MVRVLLAANNLAGGGAEKVLLMLLDALHPPKYAVDLLLVKGKGIYMDAVPRYVKIITMLDVTAHSSAFPTDPAQLEEYCNTKLSKDYDVEIAFLEGPPTKLIAHHTNTKARKIAWVHTDLQRMHWTESYYASDAEELETYERFDETVFVSEGGRKGFVQRFGQPRVKCRIIINPTDAAAIQKKAMAFEVPKYPFCFCTVASLSARKGQSRLLYAMRRLFDEGLQFHLNLLGEGDGRSFLSELVQVLDLRNYVHFLGFQQNPYPYILNCDVMISSSHAEGFPLVLCEALCLERPIIATRCAGNRDVLQEGAFGLLIDNTEEGLYQGMKRVLTDSGFIDRLRNQSCLGANSLRYETVFAQIYDLLQKKGVEIR